MATPKDTRRDPAQDGRPKGPARPRPSRPGGRPAVFLDRDGTIIEHVHFLSDPAGVRLLPGAAATIRRLREAGFACVVVTNQSGVGRGIIPEDRLHAIHDEMGRQLAVDGASVDGLEYCTVVPTLDDPAAVEHVDRKPGPGMLYRAAEALGLDLDASWMVGDLPSDVLTGINARCRGSILVLSGKSEAPASLGDDLPYHVAADLPGAADLILGDGRPSAPRDTERPRELPR